MGRISNTWELAKTSWSVLKKDRELLLLPVLSFVASVVVLGVMFGVVVATSSVGGDSESLGTVYLLLFVLAELALGVIAVFFNGALVAGAHERMTGGDPTVGSAIKRAFTRIGGLVPWAIITTTVGLVLQALRERAGWLGRIVISMIDMAWEVVTFLTVPAIVIDDLGAIDGLKRSASLLKSTWGENLIARVGFGLLGFVLIIPGLAVGALAFASGSGVLTLIGIAVAGFWVAVVVVVMTTLNAIFQTALYMYATTGRRPAGFEQAPLAETFTPK